MPNLQARPMRFTILLTAGIALSGCMVGPDYRSAHPQMAASSAPPPACRPAAAPQADLAAWWRAFGDSMLDQVVNQALAENLDLAQAVARVDQARAAAGIARAALLPSGELNASAATARQSIETPIGRIEQALGVDRNGNLYEADAGASWEADVFGGLRRGRQAALADYQAADAGAAAARVAVIAEAADTYILLRTLQARLAVAREQAEAQRQLLGLARLQYARGILAEGSLHEAESGCTSVEAQVPTLESALESATNALEVLMGVAPGSWHAALAAPSAIPAPPAITSADGPASLLRRRPDIIVAERKLAAANARIGAAIAEYYPQFSISALLGFSSTSGRQPVRLRRGRGAGYGGRALAPVRFRPRRLGSGGCTRTPCRGAGDLSPAGAAGDRGCREYLHVARQEPGTGATAAVERGFARPQQQSVRIAQARGAASRVEVLQSTTRLLQARDARVTAQSDTARAAIASFRALGGGWHVTPSFSRTAQK